LISSFLGRNGDRLPQRLFFFHFLNSALILPGIQAQSLPSDVTFKDIILKKRVTGKSIKLGAHLFLFVDIAQWCARYENRQFVPADAYDFFGGGHDVQHAHG